MSLERRIVNSVRALTAAAMVYGVAEIPSLSRFTGQEPTKTQASELQLSQYNIADISPRLVPVVDAIESRSLPTIAAYVDDSIYWGPYLAGGQKLNKSAFVDRVASIIRNNSLSCTGYMMIGRNRNQPAVIIEGFTLNPANNKNSLVTIELVPVKDDLRFLITRVQELTDKNMQEIKGMIKPCRGKVETPTPIPTQIPKIIDADESGKIPDNLKNTRIAYTLTENGEENIYSSKLDGTDKKKLTSDSRAKRDLSATLSGNIIYSSYGKSDENGGKMQVVNLDIKEGNKEKVVWEVSSRDGGPFCSSEAGGNIYWSNRELTNDRMGVNIWSAGRDGSNPTRITDDNLGNSEECPVVAKDGKVAIKISTVGSHGSRPQGIAVYPNIDTLGNDFNANNFPELIKGDIPIGWTHTNELVFTRQEEEGDSLYRASSDGKNEVKIMQGVLQARISPDGKYAIVKASRDYQGGMYLVPLDGSRLIKLSSTFEKALYPILLSEKPNVARKIVATLQGMNSSVYENKGGDLTRELYTFLSLIGYSRDDGDLIHMSVNGGNMENGRWIAKDQSCTDTQRDPETLGLVIAEDFKKILESDPEIELISLNHSYGGVIAANAMEQIQNGQVKLDQNRLRIITIDSPIQGVNKPFFDYLGAFFEKFYETKCFVGSGVPNFNYFNTPAGQTLLNMWDDRTKTQERWEKAVTKFQANGGQIYSLGNIQDCVMAVEVCVTDINFEMNILFKLFWRRFAVVTQEMPGANNIWRALGVDNLGHDRYFKGEGGVSVLMSLIGPQISKN